MYMNVWDVRIGRIMALFAECPTTLPDAHWWATSEGRRLGHAVRMENSSAGCRWKKFHLFLRTLLWMLVGGLKPSEKYESQLGWLFPIYGKIKNGNQTTNQECFAWSFVKKRQGSCCSRRQRVSWRMTCGIEPGWRQGLWAPIVPIFPSWQWETRPSEE